MTSFKEDLDEDVKNLHKFISEELEMKSLFEQRILLEHYWKSMQRGAKKQKKQLKERENLDLSHTDEMYK